MKNKMTVIAACLALVTASFIAAGAQEGAQRQKMSRARRNAKAVQSATVTLTDEGYQPASLKLRRGVPARVTFIRRIEETCGTEIALPAYNIRRALPLNKTYCDRVHPRQGG